MAYVKTRFSHDAKAKLRYVTKERAERDVSDSEGCSVETAADNFEAVRQLFNREGGNECLHIVQSWDAKESALKTPEEFNAIGKRLASELYPGHQFVIRTHTDQGHIHNHIVLNTVNSETGKRIQNKKSVIQMTRNYSDKLCLENGLSVIDSRDLGQKAHLPFKVQQMVRFNRPSYLYDIVQKADFARQYATHMNEYQEILGAFNITTRVTEKTISYFYPGREKGKRGSKLGKRYDKEGLASAFERNEGMCLARPEARNELTSLIRQIKQGKAVSIPAPERVGASPTAPPRPPRPTPSEEALKNSPLSSSEIRRAKWISIARYCEMNRIELKENAQGKKVLKGREHIVVGEDDFRNTRNGTRGTLIDFVAAHKSKTYLQAIADLNHNPKLLLLEEHMGVAKRNYNSFYFPKESRLEWKGAANHLGSLMREYGLSEKLGQSLHEKGYLQVSHKGIIRLFPERDDSGAIEFEKEGLFWKRKPIGNPSKPFFKTSRGNIKHAVIYTDPIFFLQKMGENLFYKNFKFDVLCLMGSDRYALDQHLVANPNIKSVHFIGLSEKQKEDLDFFGNLKKSCGPLGIELHRAKSDEELSRTLEIEGRGHGLSR